MNNKILQDGQLTLQILDEKSYLALVLAAFILLIPWQRVDGVEEFIAFIKTHLEVGKENVLDTSKQKQS